MTIKTKITSMFHPLITLYILLGWIPNNKNALLVHMTVITLIILHWVTNDNKCFLSQVTHGDDENEYVRNIFRKLGFKSTENINADFTYIVLAFFFLISYYKISYVMNT